MFTDVSPDYLSRDLRTYRAVETEEFSLDVTITRVASSVLDVSFHRCDSSQNLLKVSGARRIISCIISALHDTLGTKNQMIDSMSEEIEIQMNVVFGSKSSKRVLMYARLVEKYIPAFEKSNLIPFVATKTVVTTGSVVIFIKRTQ